MDWTSGASSRKPVVLPDAQYQSMTKASYNNKGDASLIRSKLDEDKKNDLRRNHFEIGGNSA